jgi:hypothetical protein
VPAIFIRQQDVQDDYIRLEVERQLDGASAIGRDLAMGSQFLEVARDLRGSGA